MPSRPSSPRSFRAFALAAALLTLPGAAAAGAGYSGRFECTDVLEGEDLVSMTFELSVVSHRSEEITGATVRLVDASDPEMVYAQFSALHFVQGADVPMSAAIVLGRPEWERWSSGAPPRVRLDAQAADGTDLGAMVDLVRISSPEVLP